MGVSGQHAASCDSELRVQSRYQDTTETHKTYLPACRGACSWRRTFVASIREPWSDSSIFKTAPLQAWDHLINMFANFAKRTLDQTTQRQKGSPKPRDRQGAVLLRSTGSQWCKARHEEVQASKKIDVKRLAQNTVYQILRTPSQMQRLPERREREHSLKGRSALQPRGAGKAPDSRRSCAGRSSTLARMPLKLQPSTQSAV